MGHTESGRIRLAVWGYAIALIVVIAVASDILFSHWSPDVLPSEVSPTTTDPRAAAERARDLEVIKICLQIIGVGVISAILGLAATRIEALRREHREGFEIRAELLDRSTRCAHTMYVACQHYARTPRRSPRRRPPVTPARASNLDALHDAYQAFAAEARAIEALIGARYTAEPRGDLARAGFPWDRRSDARAGESWWRWHQLRDLLTVYYFSLIRDFRENDKVLTENELNEKKYHSGLRLNEIKNDSPSDLVKASCKSPPDRETELWRGDKYDRIPRFVRREFDKALPQFVDALRIDTPRKDR